MTKAPGRSRPRRAFYLEPLTIDLVREHRDLIVVIKRQLGEVAPVAVVLDTLNRRLHGSENTEDMSAYVRATDAVREAFQCSVIIIHHRGHNAERPRGHTALMGAADAMLAVRRGDAGQILVTVDKMKDGEAGEVFASRLESITVGMDEDGGPITSCVVEPVELDTATRQSKPPRLSHSEQIAFKALQYAIAEAGVAAPGSNHIPQGNHVRVVTVEQWNTYARLRGISDSKETKVRNQAFKRAKEGLLAKQKAGCWEQWVWPIPAEGHKGHNGHNRDPL